LPPEKELHVRKNWGLALCVDTSSVPGGALGGGWKTMTVDFSGAPYQKLNVLVHKAGDPDANDFTSAYYCNYTASGVALRPQDFDLSCWGDSLPGETFSDIDRVCLFVPPANDPFVYTPRAVENLCITRITFGN
jgi:hypothetical protein